jgi:hypothetical protein
MRPYHCQLRMSIVKTAQCRMKTNFVNNGGYLYHDGDHLSTIRINHGLRMTTAL